MRIKIAELFAGVGGFREAVEHGTLKNHFEVSWSNQWEPSESAKHGDLQNANRVYIAKFGNEGHYTDDIHLITDSEKKLPKDIADIQMLVGGFPCQDYSVAKPKNSAKGIRGPKGVLWWSIERILRDVRPNYVLLENVDRLINSPSANRGRDFAVILKGLDSLGYVIEWRIVNAADYGFAQKRRRIFILAYQKDSPAGKRIGATKLNIDEAIDAKGLMAQGLPCRPDSEKTCFDLGEYGSDNELGAKYKAPKGKSPFFNAGFVINGKAWTKVVKAITPKKTTPLGKILLNPEQDTMPANSTSFRLSPDVLLKWAYAKGRKNEPRRKAITVANFLKSKLGITIPAKAAKQLPIDLKMDTAFDFTFDDKTVRVSLAREEVNYRIAAALNLKDATFDRPNAVTRTQIEQAQANKETWSKVEAGAVAIATDRAFSLLGLKGKELLGQVAAKIHPQVVKVVAELTKKDKAVEFSASGKTIKVDRDTLAANTFAYGYKEGGLPFPDRVDGPGRTIITSEGGASVSRFKHVICEACASGKGQHKTGTDCVKAGKLRRLYPEELERMNGFSAGHSKTCRELKISDGKRAFFMGNALVVDVVRNIMESLGKAAFGRG
ncbi:MAG: DNA (cytosine-5-)-methyltransferase [Chthoniobacteraceae bacterium]|nr:DNA (cytosine-5-)-methyltransferase [Chthoniobacteraceae bacterium]